MTERQRILLAQAKRMGDKSRCPVSGLPIKAVRLFGHQDEIGKDHHGPASRWEKQRRRHKARRDRRKANAS